MSSEISNNYQVPANAIPEKRTIRDKLADSLSMFGRTAGIESGGLYILKSQPQCTEASGWTKAAHLCLGAAKTLGAIVFVTSGLYFAAQLFTGVTGLAVLLGSCLFLAVAGNAGAAVGGAILAYTTAPSLLLCSLVKSSYHDFKLMFFGKA